MRHLIPNSTQIPDIILDHWMAHLSGADFKVLMYIARRTYGFGRESAAISLSQIANGLVKRDGTRLDSGTGGSRSSVARSLKNLEVLGLIVRHQNFNDAIGDFDQNTYSINLDWVPPTGEDPSPFGENDEAKGVVSNRDHLVSKPNGGWSQSETRGSLGARPGVVSKSDYIRETERETGRETAAAISTTKKLQRSTTSKPSAAVFNFEEKEPTPEALALSEELIRAGLNRTDARRLAATSPEESKRQLEYLPFKADLENPGAYLRRAIEGSFSPPAGYLEAKRQEQEAQKKRAQAEATAKKKAEAEAAVKRAGELLDAEIENLRQQAPEEFEQFEAFIANELRVRLSRFSSTRLQQTLTQDFASAEKRRELYREWRAQARMPIGASNTPVVPENRVGATIP